MKFISFASSSKGNCALISYKNTNILVDCGISRKRIVENLKEFGLTIDDISCILITHEHSDHILGLPMILKNNKINVLSQKPTLNAIIDYCEKKNVSFDYDCLRIIKPLNADNDVNYLQLNDIKIYPIKSFHDVPCVFYKFILGDVKIAIMTDIGVYNDYIIRSISDVDYLMLECNYDKQMLLDCSYDPWLKNRIMGEGGHLSNVDCAEIIMKIANPRLKKIYLSHISDESNSEEYAFEFVNRYLKQNGNKIKKLPEIYVAKRVEKTEIINFT